jgi:hypothetical protein
MKTALECLPCLVRQAFEASRIVDGDADLRERIMREALVMTAQADLSGSPLPVVQRMQRRIRELAGDEDPFGELKRRSNEAALALLPSLAERVRTAPDPLTAAIRVAIAGNTIDVGASGTRSTERIEEAIDGSHDQPFHGDVEAFRRALADAGSILYLADNAGEIVFDTLLAAQLPAGRVTFAVRGAPVLNDATLADAEVAGLERFGEVVSNGSDAPGTLLSDCTPDFRARFAAADLIIAKGQGNYESLSDEPADIFFLFTVKCPVVAALTGLEPGTQALLRSTDGHPTTARHLGAEGYPAAGGRTGAEGRLAADGRAAAPDRHDADRARAGS